MSIKKVAASSETLAAASAKAKELEIERAKKPDRLRRNAGIASAVGGGAFSPAGAAIGGALAAERGNKGRTAARAGLGSLAGGVAAAAATRGRSIGAIRAGSAIGGALGADSAYKSRERDKDRIIRQYEQAKTAALVGGFIDTLNDLLVG